MGILKKRSFLIIFCILVCLYFMSVEQLFVVLIGMLFYEIIIHEKKLKVRFFPGFGWYLYFIAAGVVIGASGIILYNYAFKHVIKDVIYVLFPFLFWILGQNIRLFEEDDTMARMESFTQLFVAGVIISLYDLINSLYRIFSENMLSMTSLYNFRSVIGVGYYVTLFTLFLYIFMPQNILFKKMQANICLIILIADMLIHFSRTTWLCAIVFLLYSGIVKNPIKLFKAGLLIISGALLLYISFPYIFENFLSKLMYSVMEMSYSHTWNMATIVNNWRGYEVYCEMDKFQNANMFEKLFGGGFGAQLDVKGYAYLVTTEETIPFLHNGYYSILMIWGVVGWIIYFLMLSSLYLKGSVKTKQEQRFWRALIIITALNTLFVHGPFFSPGVSSVFLYLGILETKRRRDIYNQQVQELEEQWEEERDNQIESKDLVEHDMKIELDDWIVQDIKMDLDMKIGLDDWMGQGNKTERDNRIEEDGQMEDLEQLHSVLVEILDFVCSVCEEHGLTYFLVYGTALGAYRHKGFIPWDDDMDIAMPRQDFMKFLNIMKQEEYDRFEIQDEDNEKNYFLTFAKVRKKNTLYIEKITGNRYSHNGIFIDVFPLDHLNEIESFSFKIRYKFIRYLIHILRFNACRDLYKSKRSKRDYVFDWAVSFPAFLIPSRVILKQLKRLEAGKEAGNETKYMVEYDSGSANRIMDYDIFFPPRKIEFEKKMYNVPNRIEDYLSLIYGDYMQLPPVDERKSKKASEIKF